MAFDRLHRLIDRIGDAAWLRALRKRRFARRFGRRMGHAFFGCHPTFAAAAAAAPTGLPPSYDNDEAAAMYVDRMHPDEHDYPVLFWLLDSLRQGHRRVCDLGGSVGIKYFAFAPLLPLNEVRWHVVEVPAAVALGTRIAAERGVAAALTFGTEQAAAADCDVLLASGVLQYLPRSLAEILAGLPTKPRRVLVNTTPIHPQCSFFTLNNIGTACCPYRVTAEPEFVGAVSALGYRLRDRWRNLGKRLDLPYEPGLSLRDYSGFCFDREG